jgi:hypothetical protein
LFAAGCALPLSTPGNTASVEYVGTSTLNGWRYDYYRNLAYPCSISGYQTFVIGRKDGSSTTKPRPLWVHMHGGGAGYFDADGNPVPGVKHKVEEDFVAPLRNNLSGIGLVARVRNDTTRQWRTLAVSYCSHDVYAGFNSDDPHNPNTTPDRSPRYTTGTLATKAAIQYATALYPTTDVILHGVSAGSTGTFAVAWSLQEQGIAPDGIVADASVLNQEVASAAYAQGLCLQDSDPGRRAAIGARVHPDFANIANEPDKLVSTGRLTVPVMHIWNHADVSSCGDVAMQCPLRDGTTVTMGLTDCIHDAMRRAITAQGPSSRSKNLPLCVNAPDQPPCSKHGTTYGDGLPNTDPGSPSDFLVAIMDWVHVRLTDD